MEIKKSDIGRKKEKGFYTILFQILSFLRINVLLYSSCLFSNFPFCSCLIVQGYFWTHDVKQRLWISVLYLPVPN